MLIKVIKNGEISEWREHNQEIHKQMLRDKPEYEVINICKSQTKKIIKIALKEESILYELIDKKIFL